jgi:hypothetical protein
MSDATKSNLEMLFGEETAERIVDQGHEGPMLSDFVSYINNSSKSSSEIIAYYLIMMSKKLEEYHVMQNGEIRKLIEQGKLNNQTKL